MDRRPALLLRAGLLLPSLLAGGCASLPRMPASEPLPLPEAPAAAVEPLPPPVGSLPAQSPALANAGSDIALRALAHGCGARCPRNRARRTPPAVPHRRLPSGVLRTRVR